MFFDGVGHYLTHFSWVERDGQMLRDEILEKNPPSIFKRRGFEG